MIANGFIKDVDGDWFSIVGLDRVVVTRMAEEYMGDMDNYWQIEAIWIVDGEDCSVIIDKNLDSLIGAQLRLDSIMGR